MPGQQRPQQFGFIGVEPGFETRTHLVIGLEARANVRAQPAVDARVIHFREIAERLERQLEPVGTVTNCSNANQMLHDSHFIAYDCELSIAVKQNAVASVMLHYPFMATNSTNTSAALLDRRAIVRHWIADIEQRYNVSHGELAARAGIAPSTIYRLFDDRNKFEPSARTIAAIAQAYGEEPPAGEAPKVPGFGDGDVQDALLDDTPQELRPHSPNEFVKRVTSRALELEGVLPGDIVLVDMAAEPTPGRVVIAQVYHLHKIGADTKLRLFEPPYLTTRTMDRTVADRPLYVDNERVVVLGTVTRIMRTFS